MVYELKFNDNYDGFTSHIVFHEFETPQDYLHKLPDINQQYLIVEVRGVRQRMIYMVVYHPRRGANATHPWTQYSWVRDLSPWGDNQQLWIQNVEAYLRRHGLL